MLERVQGFRVMAGHKEGTSDLNKESKSYE